MNKEAFFDYTYRWKRPLKIAFLIFFGLVAIWIVFQVLFGDSRVSYNLATDEDYGESEFYGVPSAAPAADYAYDSSRSKTGAASGGGSAVAQEGAASANTEDRKIISNGSIEMMVSNVEAAIKDVSGIGDRLGGFISYSNVWEDKNGQKEGSITIRVPSSNFRQAIDDIKKLAIKVERENTNAQDVTEQFVDLEARLANLKAEEEQYLEIMEDADTVEDTLKVTEHLYRVRGQIEQIEGTLKYLSSAVEMAAISVGLSEEPKAQEVSNIVWRPWTVVKDAFHDMTQKAAEYVNAMIRFLFALPVILLWILTILLIVYIVWKIAVRIKDKIAN